MNDTNSEADRQRRLEFDWYNHLTTLSVIIIGGMIGFLPEVPNARSLTPVGLVVIGGAIAVGASHRLVRGTAARWWAPVWIERQAYLFLAFGVGAFLGQRFG